MLPSPCSLRLPVRPDIFHIPDLHHPVRTGSRQPISLGTEDNAHNQVTLRLPMYDQTEEFIPRDSITQNDCPVFRTASQKLAIWTVGDACDWRRMSFTVKKQLS